MNKSSVILTIAITLLLSAFMAGCGEDEADIDTRGEDKVDVDTPGEDKVDVESLYKELVGTYDLLMTVLTTDGAKLVAEPPNVAGTMTISSDKKVTMKFQVFDSSEFITGSFEILPDEGVMLIDVEAGDLNPKATYTYTWDGKILTTAVGAGADVGKHFWRKLNNNVIELQPPEPQFPPELESEPPPPSAAFVSANPPFGSTIAVDAIITLTFDNIPADVTVNSGRAVVDGRTVVVEGPFIPGPLELKVTWDNGFETLRYIVFRPDVDPPVVTGATVRDGDKDVNPALLNNDGIEITFSEDVTGIIALQTEDGDDVGWIGWVEGNKAALEAVKGREIGNETTYVIKGKVADAAGNETEVNITFTTMGFE